MKSRSVFLKLMAIVCAACLIAPSSIDVNAQAYNHYVSNPRIQQDSSASSGVKVTYDCVWFGSYPQTEMVLKGGAEEKLLEDMKNKFGSLDYISLPSVNYAIVKNASYDANDTTTVNLNGESVKIKRVKATDRLYSNGNKYSDRYKWADKVNYHYFKYEPVKWRVLSDTNDEMFIFAAKALNTVKYSNNFRNTDWENCSLREYLNTTFIDDAFTRDEKAVILDTMVESPYYTENPVGDLIRHDTIDKVYILSDDELGKDMKGYNYGFAGIGKNDESKRIQPTTYAFAMGAYREPRTVYSDGIIRGGCCDYWTRTWGSVTESAYNAGVILSNGAFADSGNQVTDDWIAMCPVLKIKTSSLKWTPAGTYCTDGTYNENAQTGGSNSDDDPAGEIGYIAGFTDTDSSKWYASGVQFVIDGGIMSGYKNPDGTPAHLFGPNDTIKRREFAVMIYRMVGEPEVKYTGRFPDVSAGKWYADAVEWCAANNIITGRTNTGMFDPDADIMRQEIAAIIQRYAFNIDRKSVVATADLSAFPDAAAVSSYAVEPIKWCVEKGILTGKENTATKTFYLEPKSTATRAEAATMIMRYIKL